MSRNSYFEKSASSASAQRTERGRILEAPGKMAGVSEVQSQPLRSSSEVRASEEVHCREQAGEY